jgi:8-oxo-dGTP pyrophosphatase MutT (NUDIX family)
MHAREEGAWAHAAACVLVIRAPDLVLVIWNERHKCWGLPGGKRELDDKHIGWTAQRELVEETGLLVYSDGLVWLFAGEYQALPQSDETPRDVHLYLARRVSKEPWPKETTLAWMAWDWLLKAAPAFRSFYESALPCGIGHLKPTEFE